MCDIRLILPLCSRSKPILRNAAKLLNAPKSIYNAPKKGFNNPLAPLLRGGLRKISDRLFLHEPGLLEPYLNPTGVAKLWVEHRDYKNDHSYALWPLLHFLLWRSSTSAI